MDSFSSSLNASVAAAVAEQKLDDDVYSAVLVGMTGRLTTLLEAVSSKIVKRYTCDQHGYGEYFAAEELKWFKSCLYAVYNLETGEKFKAVVQSRTPDLVKGHLVFHNTAGELLAFVKVEIKVFYRSSDGFTLESVVPKKVEVHKLFDPKDKTKIALHVTKVSTTHDSSTYVSRPLLQEICDTRRDMVDESMVVGAQIVCNGCGNVIKDLTREQLETIHKCSVSCSSCLDAVKEQPLRFRPDCHGEIVLSDYIDRGSVIKPVIEAATASVLGKRSRAQISGPDELQQQQGGGGGGSGSSSAGMS